MKKRMQMMLNRQCEYSLDVCIVQYSSTILHKMMSVALIFLLSLQRVCFQ